MAETKEVKNIRAENQLKAITSHKGFVDYVVGKVTKIGIEKVLKSSKIKYEIGKEKKEDYYWLKQSYERVLEFAEQIQIKQIPNKVEGSGEDGAIVITYLPKIKEENV